MARLLRPWVSSAVTRCSLGVRWVRDLKNERCLGRSVPRTFLFESSADRQIGHERCDAILCFQTHVSLFDVDFHVTGHNLENLPTHLLQQLGIEIAPVVGQYKLQTLPC